MGGTPRDPHNAPFPSPTLAEDILQAIQTLVVVLNSQGHAVYVSPSIERILGFTAEEVLGENYFEKIKSPDEQGRRDLREMLSKAAKGEIPIFKAYATELLTKSGESRWILWHDAKGPGDLLIGAGQDITELRNAEHEIERRVQDFRAIFDRSSEGILILNNAWVYIDANPAACLIFGVDKERIVGKKHGELLQSPLNVMN